MWCSDVIGTFFTAYSLLLWNIGKTNPLPSFPIFTAVAFLPGNGYLISPVNLVRSLCNYIKIQWLDIFINPLELTLNTIYPVLLMFIGKCCRLVTAPSLSDVAESATMAAACDFCAAVAVSLMSSLLLCLQINIKLFHKSNFVPWGHMYTTVNCWSPSQVLLATREFLGVMGIF